MELTWNRIELVIDLVPQLGSRLTSQGAQNAPLTPEERCFQEAERSELAPVSPTKLRGRTNKYEQTYYGKGRERRFGKDHRTL